MNRREKLFLVWALSATLLVLVLAGVVVLMLLPHYPTTYVLGDVGGFPVGSVTHVQFQGLILSSDPRRVPSDRIDVWVVHEAPDQWRAFFAPSTHLGCIVNWQAAKQRFEDPCGGSKFARDGKYLEGPAPRGLARFVVIIKNGVL